MEKTRKIIAAGCILCLFIGLGALLSNYMPAAELPESLNEQTTNYTQIAEATYLEDGSWNLTWGGALLEYCEDCAVSTLGNIYITGTTESYGDSDGDIFLNKGRMV